MDSLKGAFDSFTGGNNNQRQGQNQGHGYNNMESEGQTRGYNQGYGSIQGEMGHQGYNAMEGQNPMHNQVTQPNQQQQTQQGSSGGFLSGLSNKFNTAAGGGVESEKNEDYLDKGVDFVQEKFLGQGPQNNESAIEQAKDEQISDYIRGQYKNTTGKDFFIKDKETRFG